MNIENILCYRDTALLEIYELFNKAPVHGFPAGIALVVNSENQLVGTITDGDIRRKIIEHKTMDLTAAEVMQSSPIYFYDNLSISEILGKIPDELAKRGRKSKRFLSKIVLVDNNKIPTRVLEYHQLWEQKVADHRHLIVIGLGYVGLTMGLVMADAGFKVTGYDINSERISQLQKGHSYIHELGLEALLKEQLDKNFIPDTEIPDNGDVYVISVGTPVEPNPDGIMMPSLKYIEDACKKIGHKLNTGNLVILRSTVQIGTCREIVKPLLEKYSGLRCGIDFHLSFAPERTAEGKALKELRSLPQVIGGYNKDSLEATAAIFRDLTPMIVKVDSLEAAEMVKLINNSFRDYVFAYSNQISKIANGYNINIVDVIHSANKGYPRNPVPLPSPGVGGPCLTKDPHIFAYSANKLGADGNIFRSSRSINESMHNFIAERLLNEIVRIGKEPASCRVLICGLAFKGNPETGDLRNSTSLDIANLLRENIDELYGYDYVASDEEIRLHGFIPVKIPEGFEGMDVIMFLNNHKIFEQVNVFDMTRTLNEKPIIFDGWNLFRSEEIISVKPSVYMGLSFKRDSIHT